jgi:hypothetical protein
MLTGMHFSRKNKTESIVCRKLLLGKFMAGLPLLAQRQHTTNLGPIRAQVLYHLLNRGVFSPLCFAVRKLR